MANTYVIGGKGTGADASDKNGGAFNPAGTATYSTFQGTNGGPIATCSAGTISNAAGFVVITKAGQFATVVNNSFANCVFTGVLTSGRYEVASHTNDTITLVLSYVAGADAETADVYVGGALDKLETVDSLLSSGDTLLIPNGSSGQRTYTEANTCTIGAASAGYTINIKGVANDGTEITPHRDVAAGGGTIANCLLDTSQFPKIAFANDKHLTTGDYNCLKNLHFTGDEDATDGIIYGVSQNAGILQNCIVVNSGTGFVVRLNNYCTVYNCDIISTANDHTYYCLYIGQDCTVMHSRFTSAGDNGTVDGLINIAGPSPHILYNVFYDLEGGTAILGIAGGTYLAQIIGNTFFNIAGVCLSTTNAACNRPLTIVDNLAVDCTTFMDSLYAGNVQNLFAAQNAFNNCGTIFTANEWFGVSATTTADRSDVTITDATPFVDEGNKDFNLDGSSATASEAVGASVFKTNLGALSHSPNYSAEADTFYGTGTYGIGGEFTPAMRASDIANCEAGNVKDGVTIDDVTGTYAGGGGGGLMAHPGMNGGINA